MTRKQIATELMRDCPEDTLADHRELAHMIRDNEPRETILDRTATMGWAETYVWLKTMLPADPSSAARALRAIPSEARAQASRENGKRGGRPKGRKK